MKRLLIVVDFQNDFVDGSLGFKNAHLIEDAIVNMIKDYELHQDEIIYTMDTHPQNYLDTYEGSNLPVEHCIINSQGWELYGKVRDLLKHKRCFKKPTFPSLELANYLKNQTYESITLVGLVSHICVLSNAIMAKAACPDTPIRIIMEGTDSFDKETQQKSIDVMKSMQIEIIEKGNLK